MKFNFKHVAYLAFGASLYTAISFADVNQITPVKTAAPAQLADLIKHMHVLKPMQLAQAGDSFSKDFPAKPDTIATVKVAGQKPVQLAQAETTESLPDTIPADSPTNVTVTATTTDKPSAETLVTASADEPAKPKSTARLWNLQDADILSVINEVSQETGKNFAVDPRVSGKITLVSSKPLQKHEVYQVFLSVLGLLGYSAIPNGNVIKIVPNMESGENATRLATNEKPGKGDEVVVRVIPLSNISATQLIPILRPMLPQWSNVASYAPGNILVLLGRASNIERIVNVIQEVDSAANSGIQMIPLKHASAVQVAAVLNNLQNAARTTGETPSVSIAVDERSNSILLGGPKASRLRMRLLVSQLDAPSTAPSGNTEVVYLRYLEAKTFAPLLGKIAQNILGKSSSGSSAGFEASTAANATTSAAAGGATATSTNKEVTVSNSSNIQAEPNSNSVIITAPPALMVALKGVIAKLDIRPAQVEVEAIIAEVDEGDLTSFGIQWGSVTPEGYVQQPVTPTSFPNFGAGVVGIMPHVQIQAVLTALRNTTGVNILSTPSVVVLDNQKATIEVGQNVPTQTGSYASTANSQTATPFTTNDYKAVTLKLDVSPQINLGESVRLKLKLKNDTLRDPQNPGLTPIINTSSITNSVIINSEDVLVLGGLISNSNNENINRVPILSSIPVIGPMFTQKTSDQRKRNLMVFIKPIIMKTPQEAMTVSHNKYNMAKSIEANYVDDLATIGEEPLNSNLPPWGKVKELPMPFEKEEGCDA